jgi:hypothetical protein
MNAIVMAAAHAIKLGAIPMSLEPSISHEANEKYFQELIRKFFAYSEYINIWISESQATISDLRNECIKKSLSGEKIDLQPIINSIDSVIENRIIFYKELSPNFERLREKIKPFGMETYERVSATMDDMLELINTSTDALSEIGLAWRALQHEYGPAELGSSLVVTDPSQLDNLLRH